MRRLTVALALTATALLGACACGPPSSLPPLAGTPIVEVDAFVEAMHDAGTCRASLGALVNLVDDRTMWVESDVIVRGVSTPMVPCAYNAWSLSATLDCIGPGGSCGSWTLPTPNGDTGTPRHTFTFRARPDEAVLRVTFAAVWLGVGGKRDQGSTTPIRCDPITVGTRCRFQPAN
jgi:hypothetical protein